MTNEKTTRVLVAHRSGGNCEAAIHGICTGQATTMHHRLKRSQGGRWEAANIMHLCGTGTTGCHGYIEAHPAVARRNGWWIFTGDGDPQDVPVLARVYDATKKLIALNNDGTWATWPDHVATKTSGPAAGSQPLVAPGSLSGPPL